MNGGSLSYKVRFFLASSLSLSAPVLVFAALMVFVSASEGPGGYRDAATLTLTGILLFLAGFVDWIDGAVARKLGVSGSIGRFLDLYCDAVGTSIPLAAFLALSPVTFLGNALGPIASYGAAAIFIGAVVMRHAIVSDQQTREGVTRHPEFQGLVSPPLLHLMAGWMILSASSNTIPFTDVSIGMLAQENSIWVVVLFFCSAALILTKLPYLRAEDLALRTPWPWWCLLGYTIYLNIGLAWFGLQVWYILTPALLKAKVLRRARYDLFFWRKKN